MLGAARYRIENLTIPGVDVWYSMAGKEVRGYLHLTASGRPRYRIYVTEYGKRRSQDLPKHAKPDLWRPAGKWPERLPPEAIVTGPVDWKSPDPEKRRVEPSEPVVGWPYPNVRLGRAGTLPQSVQECEARILRAIRTSRVQERESGQRGGGSVWPKDLLIEAALVEKALRSSRTRKLAGFRPEDYEHFFIDESELEARPAQWKPDPRDVSDYEWRNDGPLWWPPSWAMTFFRYRAAMPIWTFGQIADKEDMTERDVIDLYVEACRVAFDRSQR